MNDARESDAEGVPGNLARWLAAHRPGTTVPRMVPLERPGSTGFSSDTLLFDVVWAADGEARSEGIAVRREPRMWRVFPAYDIGQQSRILDILATTDVPVPRVLGFEPDPAVLGAPFCVMERVAGLIPPDNPPYHVAGWVTELPPAERATLWWSGIEALARIHRLDWQALGLGFTDTPGPEATPLERQLADYERFLAWAARGRPQPLAEAALAWLTARRPREPEPVAFCWGDARPGNMIFRDQRCVAVLDWEMATLGNPVQDLAWWLYFDRHHSEGVGAARLAGFPGRAETVACWEERTGLAARHLEYYEVFAAFRFAVIMIRVAEGLVQAGILAADSGFETNNTATQLLARLLDLPQPS